MNQVYEIYARAIYQSEMYGFIEVEELVFGERAQLVVDPGARALSTIFLQAYHQKPFDRDARFLSTVIVGTRAEERIAALSPPNAAASARSFGMVSSSVISIQEQQSVVDRGSMTDKWREVVLRR